MKKLLFTLTILLISISVFSQNGTIRGFVYDKASGEPVMFCNVFLKGTTIGAPSDVNGYFNIVKVPVGDYQILVTYIGFDTLQENITMKAGKILSISN